jgi:hypothetical protein
MLDARDPDLIRAKLENLWLWALEYRENGVLDRLTPAEIALASNWHGDPDVWVESLLKSGWLDTVKDEAGVAQLYLHDWHDYAGRLIEKRKQNRERMRNARASHGGRTCGATKPNQTVPNQTIKTPTAWEVPSELGTLPLYSRDRKLCLRWKELLPTWKEAYPGVDVIAEVKKAHAWEVANPKKVKKDRPRFLQNWLSRAQDKRGGKGTPSGGVSGILDNIVEELPEAGGDRFRE